MPHPLLIPSAETQEQANQIAASVTAEYKSQGAPILNLEDAIRKDSFFTNPPKTTTTVGDPTGRSCLICTLSTVYA